MCGRFQLVPTEEALAAITDCEIDRVIPARDNIAPTEPIEVLRVRPEAEVRELIPMLWGFVPSWCADLSLASKLFNARAETAAEKATFRNSLRRRRCIIPVSGFYEWAPVDATPEPEDIFGFRRPPTANRKQCMLIKVEAQPLFALAGLWEIWQGPNGEEIDTCAILTTKSNELIGTFHDRMPVILDKRDFAVWLDPKVEEVSRIDRLLGSYPAKQMTLQKVPPLGNATTNR